MSSPVPGFASTARTRPPAPLRPGGGLQVEDPSTPSHRTKFISDGVTLKGLIFNLIGRVGSPTLMAKGGSAVVEGDEKEQEQQEQKRLLEEEQQQQKRLLLERQLRDAHSSLSQTTTKVSQLEGSLQKALDRAAASDALASDLQNSSSRLQAESIEQKEALKSLEAKQESLRKILVDAKKKHEVAVSHLESVKARNLFMSAESLKLSTKNRKLDLDLSFEKEKNEALEGNNRKLQKTCKELRGDLAKAECEVQKSGVSIASQERKIRQMSASLSSSAALAKSLRSAISAKGEEKTEEKDAMFVLSARNAELSGKFEKMSRDEHKEIRRLNEVVASLEVEKRKLELADHLDDGAMKFGVEDGDRGNGFKRAFDVLSGEKGAVETAKASKSSANATPSATPIPTPIPTPPVQTPPPSKKLKSSACGLCGNPKSGLMISCKPDKNKKCPHRAQAHIACTAKSSKARFVCEDCEKES
ncbi:hypothetical protein TrST_g6756 [Triparma strigata]|uniref:Uncharacterized protein n=1 Tax=Triparma strigata TaxID=1606541 RepID=A0A9W7BXE4_9STRA|nr:hypothetical protein TrST_g6756 [Triparma strigata]